MSKKGLEYSVQGSVRDYDTGAPIGGLKVRAYDKDFFRDQLLGGGVTDDNGRYEIVFGRDDFTGPIIKLERHPDIFVQVFDVDGELVYTSECSVLVDPSRQTSIDIGLHRRAPRATPRVLSAPFGVVIDRAALAKLPTAELLTAYRLARHPHPEHALTDRMRAAFPGLFAKAHGAPECGGEGLHETFRLLLKERAADPDPEADPYTGATVRQFFTANIVVKYTTAATLSDGSANPNMLPAGSATVPTADANYDMPNGTLIGVVRANLADLDPANTEVAPTYIQKVGLLAEYALSHFINAPFSYRDPRGALTRLEFQILALGTGVAGYAVSSDYHMELNTSNSDAQNLGTVPHELFHLVQYRYNTGGGPTNGIRGSMLEGGARLLEESINETPNRYIESAIDPSITTGVVRKGILTFPEESLLDVGGSQSLVRYAAGLLWKYIAEHHSTSTGAADEPAIGVNAYRTIIEQMVPTAGDYTIAAVRNGRAALPWYGTFDQFGYYDTAATELGSHETTWGNFLVANYLHGTWTPASAGFDARFDYLEDSDPAGNAGAKLETFTPAVAAGNKVTLAQGTAVTKTVTGHKPYASVYYEITPSTTSVPRVLRVGVTASAGMTDPLVQILRLGPGNTLVDIHRSDRTSYSKTINMTGLAKVVVIVASKEQGGDFTLAVDEVASASDVMVTRWNTRAGTEYEVDPKGWAWTWISPDIMVDTNNDGLDDTQVLFGQNNKLKIRLRNRGNADATNISVSFWYQKATPYLSTTAWIPVQNLANVTQQLANLTLTAGAEQWFEVDWCPDDDGTHHDHWCVKAAVTSAGDPNTDNKMAFRNFSNVVVGSGDTEFDAMIRHTRWTETDRLLIVPRGADWNLQVKNPKTFAPHAPKAIDYRVAAHRIVHDVPYDLRFAKLRLARADHKLWDRRTTALPDVSGAYYPVDEQTLPPGVSSDEIVTLAHMSDGRVVGGVSYRVPRRRL